MLSLVSEVELSYEYVGLEMGQTKSCSAELVTTLAAAGRLSEGMLWVLSACSWNILF